MQCTLSLIETSGIQSYVFGSNQLREIIGASELVRQATGISSNARMKGGGDDWGLKTLTKMQLTHNVDPDTGQIQKELRVEEGHVQVEVIYSGGGNLALVFGGKDHAENAKEFFYQLSYKALLEAPGLNLNAVHLPFDFDQDSLLEKKFAAQEKLQESECTMTWPLLGLGVTLPDTATGWPVVGISELEPKELASAQRLSKGSALSQATARLRSTLKVVNNAGYHFSDQIDRLGGKAGEEDFIAMVHIDGNGIGVRRLAWEKRHAGRGRQANRTYIQAVREFSESLSTAATKALIAATQTVLSQLKPDQEQPTFPIRPIIFGGDDITLVADSPWGLEISIAYMECFLQETLCDGVQGYASAGVCFVKTHYPLSRAYALSEELRSSARDRVAEVDPDKKGTAIDWHIVSGSILGDLKEIRRREFQTPIGQLHARPLLISIPDAKGRDWATFKRLWLEFDKSEWKEARNKRAALREVLRQGETAVEQFRYIYRQKDKPLALPDCGLSIAVENGWIKGDEPNQAICLHFDALEALDTIRLEVGS